MYYILYMQRKQISIFECNNSGLSLKITFILEADSTWGWSTHSKRKQAINVWVLSRHNLFPWFVSHTLLSVHI